MRVFRKNYIFNYRFMQQFCVSWARNYDISNNYSFTKLYNIIHTHKFEQANRICNKGRQQKYLTVPKSIFISLPNCNEDDREQGAERRFGSVA